MNKIKYSFVILISILTLVACSEPASVEHWIDNPTAKEITISIDGNPLTIPAKSGVNYQFEYGKHVLSYNNDSVSFIVKSSKFPGFINPTQSNYIFYKTVFIDKSDPRATESFLNDLEKDISYKTSMIVDGKLQELSVPFKVVNDLFIEKDNYYWDYSVDEPLPNVLTLQPTIITKRNTALARDENYKSGKFQAIKAKLFREDAFLNYLKKEGATEQISFPHNPNKLSQLPKVIIAKIDLNGIACTEGRTDVETKLADWDHILTLSGSDFADKYKKIESIDVAIAISDLERKCYENYNGDYTYKQAIGKIQSVLHANSRINFFIIE